MNSKSNSLVAPRRRLYPKFSRTVTKWKHPLPDYKTKVSFMKASKLSSAAITLALALGPAIPPGRSQTAPFSLNLGNLLEGKRLFDEETFRGSGRTCLTCDSRETGTISPVDARRIFASNSQDPHLNHN